MSDSNNPKRTCCDCGTQACAAEPGTAKHPSFCLQTANPEVLATARKAYTDPATRAVAAAAARTEASGYCRDTRIEEIIAFARRLGVTHLGIACCIGLKREARAAAEIFRAAGFEVTSVICKAGGMPKEELGLEDAEDPPRRLRGKL